MCVAQGHKCWMLGLQCGPVEGWNLQEVGPGEGARWQSILPTSQSDLLSEKHSQARLCPLPGFLSCHMTMVPAAMLGCSHRAFTKAERCQGTTLEPPELLHITWQTNHL